MKSVRLKAKSHAGNVAGQIAGENCMHLTEMLYQTMAGRLLLKCLIRPSVSERVGRWMDTGASKALIPLFVKWNGIRLEDYEPCSYDSFNAFFIRQIRKGCRQIEMDPDRLIAPCDGRLTVCRIDADSRFEIKGRPYTMGELVRSGQLEEHYRGGWLLLFRLTVSDYHRYCYPADCSKTKNYHVSGVFHTVHPVAAAERPIYKENTREFFILRTGRFGHVLMMQVGALLVGRIVNHHQAAVVRRGQEAGMFEYGGSTVILCVEPGRLQIREDILEASAKGTETVVRMGEAVGERL